MIDEKMAKSYNLLGITEPDQIVSIPYRYGRTDYLLTREIPAILKKYNLNKTLLDFGCGPGLSTRFLKSLGLDVIGVDISNNVLKLAKGNDPLGSYVQINSDGHIPFETETFDIVMSTFVLFAIPTIDNLISIFKNIHKVLSKDGVFIAVTGSTELYQRDWLSLRVKEFPENKNPKSGDICRIILSDIDLLLEDYYWTDDDYTYVANQSGFQIANKSYPLGLATDGIPWKDEMNYPPYVFYEFTKI